MRDKREVQRACMGASGEIPSQRDGMIDTHPEDNRQVKVGQL
jgi:hypothetical protein